MKIKFSLLLAFIFSLLVQAQQKKYGYVAMGGGGYVTSIIASPFELNTFYAKTDVGGIFRWNETTQSWSPLFSWVSPAQTSYLGTEAFCIDKGSPNIIYTLGGTNYWNGGITAVMRSTNYGNTFSVTDVTAQFRANGNGSDRQKGETMVVDPAKPNVLYCGTRYSNGLYKSTNSGASWSKVTTFPDSIGLKASFSFVALDDNSATADGCKTIYVGMNKTENNLFVSKDGGITWKSLTVNTKGRPQRCAISAEGIMYITYLGGSVNGVYKLDIATGIATNITPLKTTDRGFSGIDVDMNDPKKLVCSTYNNWTNRQPWGWSEFIYYSPDGGATWIEKANRNVATMDVNGIPWINGKAMHWVGCVTFSPNKQGWVWVVSGNGVFATENIASEKPVWKFMAKGLEETVPWGWGMMSVPGGPLMSSVGDQGGFIHTDITKAPNKNIFQSDAFSFAGAKTSVMVASNNQTDAVGFKKDANGNYILDANGNLIQIKRTQSHIQLSEDYGTTWTSLPAADTIKNGIPCVSANGKIIMWQGTNSKVTPSNRVYWTTDKGKTWTMSNNANFTSNIVSDPIDTLTFFAYNRTTGFLLKSTDGGKSFVGARYIGENASNRIRTAHGIKNSVWLNFGTSLQYTDNGGKTALVVIPVASCASFALGKAAPNANYPSIFIWGKPKSTDIYGMYRSDNKGLTWTRANDDDNESGDLANAGTIEGDWNVYSRVYKSTAGMGIHYMQLDLPDAIDHTIAENASATLYPNPFKTAVTLKLNTTTVKSVSVFNLQGILVKKFKAEELSNGVVAFGQDFATGVYMVQVVDANGSKGYKIIKQ